MITSQDICQAMIDVLVPWILYFHIAAVIFFVHISLGIYTINFNKQPKTLLGAFDCIFLYIGIILTHPVDCVKDLLEGRK